MAEAEELIRAGQPVPDLPAFVDDVELFDSPFTETAVVAKISHGEPISALDVFHAGGRVYVGDGTGAVSVYKLPM